MRNIIKKVLLESSDDYIEDFFESIDTVTIKGIYYHGTLTDNKEVFTEFKTGIYSDYDAIWFTENEDVAESFTTWHEDEDEYRVVYKVKLSSNNIADLTSESLVEDMLYELDVDGLLNAIPYLNRYDGWITKGHIDHYLYDDIAIFNPNRIDMLEYKIFKNGKWSKYKSL